MALEQHTQHNSGGVRAYGDAALRRLLDDVVVQHVNGSPVEVRSATDLPTGHLDPWVLQAQQEAEANKSRTSPLTLVRDIAELLFARDRKLLRGRAALLEHAEASPERDLSSGDVEVTRMEWTLAGEVRPVWRYARPQVAATPRAAFLHLHGGGFSAGTPNGRDPFLKLVADRTDVVIYDLDYSMLPERTFPQAVLEAQAALTHLHDNAEAWGLDTDRFVIGGGSAGGNIAAGTAVAVRDAGHPPLALQVLYSPFLSFGGLQRGLAFTPVEVTPEHRAFAGPQSFRTLGLLMKMLYRSYRGSSRSDDARMSPALAKDFSRLAPALIVAGEMDPLHQPAEHFAGDLARAGVPVRAIRYRGCLHDSVAKVGLVPQAEATALETIAAIERLRPKAPA
jgi:acetyl esterase